MSAISFYQTIFQQYGKSLQEGEWPLPDPGNPDFNLDIGLDPSMSSSGICLVLRRQDNILACRTLNHKTPPTDPSPIRLGSLTDAVQGLIADILGPIPPCSIHITILFEIPPTHMAASGWLYALSQLIWLGFGPDAPIFMDLVEQGFDLTIHQIGVGNTQLKHLYLLWANRFSLGLEFKEISKKKSAVVKIVNHIIDMTSLRAYLPKRFNNDVAEAIALAMCAGGCSRMDSFTSHPPTAPYAPVSMEDLHLLMTNTKANSHNEKTGWIFRPLTYCFGWSTKVFRINSPV